MSQADYSYGGCATGATPRQAHCDVAAVRNVEPCDSYVVDGADCSEAYSGSSPVLTIVSSTLPASRAERPHVAIGLNGLGRLVHAGGKGDSDTVGDYSGAKPDY